MDAALDATPYAELLARIASRLSNRHTAMELAAGFIISRDSFLKRVEAILSYGKKGFRQLPRWAAAATVFAGVLAVAGAVAFPLAERGDNTEKVTIRGRVTHDGAGIGGAELYLHEQKHACILSE